MMRNLPGRAYHPPMNSVRILVACEFKSYREAIAAAFRVLRPDVEVFEADEEDLDREVVRLSPELVVCSRLTTRVSANVHSWVELYPRCGSQSFVSVQGDRSTIEEIQLSDLLSILDEVAGMSARGSRAP